MNFTTTNSPIRRCGAFAIAALSFSSGLALLGQAPVSAATVINVTTMTDEFTVNGNCSLREAIASYNEQTKVDACPKVTGEATIVIPAGTLSLTQPKLSEPAISNGDLNVRHERPGLTVEGAGMNATVIDAGFKYGIFSASSSLVLRNLALKHGKANGAAAVSLNSNVVSVTLDHVLVEGNEGGDGAVGGEPGPLTIVDSRITANSLTAIRARGIFEMNRSLVDGNGNGTRDGVGLSLDGGTGRVTNSTFTNNQARSGTIDVYGANLVIESSTIVGNSHTNPESGTINTFKTGLVSVARSIFEGRCEGPNATDGGQNIASTVTGCIDPAKSTVVSKVGLGPLADNGGATPTMALIAGSPALNAVSAGCAVEDQRGAARGATCDAGAFESDLAGAPTSTTSTIPVTTLPAPVTTLPAPVTTVPAPVPTTTVPAPETTTTTAAPTPTTPTIPADSTPIVLTPVTTTSVAPSSTTSPSTTTPAASAPSPGTGGQVVVLGAVLENSEIPAAAPAVESPVAADPAADLAYTGPGRWKTITVIALAMMAIGITIVANSRRRSTR